MQKAVAHTGARLTHPPPSDVNSLGRYKVLPVLFAMATRPTLVFQFPVSRIRVTAPYLRSSITEFFRPLSPQSARLGVAEVAEGGGGGEREKRVPVFRYRCMLDKLGDRWKFRELLAHCCSLD